MRLGLFSFLTAVVVALAGPVNAASSSTMPTCASGDVVVWVNTKSHVYHMQGSRYYGNTKAGAYECKSTAEKEGNRQADVEHAKSSGGASPAASAIPGATPMPSTSPRHHHHHRHAEASPAPSATP